MLALYRKEVALFFSALTGYLVVGLFVLTMSLFLWVIPGQFNIVEGGYSTLEPFFALAPWVYLFLVPAITMRFIAEERKSGTFELLMSLPISELQVVLAKFMAGVTLVGISLLPLFLNLFTVYQLGNPSGNLDFGAMWGSFLGLFLLTIVYVALGLFASSLTDNQVISFVVAVALSFLFFQGFSSISTIPYLSFLESGLLFLSVDTHYSSLSRGVIDIRDVIYFISLTSLILYFAKVSLQIRR